MDVEIKEIMEQIINTMHKITLWYMELENCEIRGASLSKNKIENNKAINTLFGKSQELYRELQNKIEEKLETESLFYDEESDGDIVYKAEDLSDSAGYYIDDLEVYLTEAFANLNFITTYDQNGEIIEPGIYYGTPYEGLIKMEFATQKLNLNIIKKRIESAKTSELTFMDKRDIIADMGIDKFYNHCFKNAINRYIKKLKNSKDSLEQSEYQERLAELCEEKYSHYYMLMNNTYNGMFQKNDNIEKFANIRKQLDEGTESILLESMSRYEIDANVAIFMEELKDSFAEEIKTKKEIKKNSKEGKNKIDKKIQQDEIEQIEEER